MENGGKLTSGGIIIMDDNGKDTGIRPRWARVWKVGKDIDYISPGEWVLMEHGRWTHCMKIVTHEGKEPVMVQRIDPEAILLVADEQPM